jgi:hypothetical protein
LEASGGHYVTGPLSDCRLPIGAFIAELPQCPNAPFMNASLPNAPMPQ